MIINSITNANVYLNGTNLVGKVAEFEMPKIVPNLLEYKALGMPAPIDMPYGVQKMEAKLVWTSIYAPELMQAANPLLPQVIVLRARISETTAVGANPIPKSLTATIVGTFKELPLGNFKPHEQVSGLESMIAVRSLLVNIEDVNIITLDPFAGIFIVGGVPVQLGDV